MTLTVSRDDALWAYRMLLGREPESEEVLQQHAASYPDRTALISGIVASPEFSQSASSAMALWNSALPTSGAQRVSPSGGKILLIGNCQSSPLSNCIQALTGNILPSYIEIVPNRLHEIETNKIDLLPLLRTHELIFVQSRFKDLLFEKYPQAGHKFLIFPNISFPAFHPDLVYITATRDGGLLQGPLSDYHSSLALYGFLNGMNIGETISLFRDEIYEALGFFDYWDKSVQWLQREVSYCGYLEPVSRDMGFSLDALLGSWTRRGCFMHSVNHPKTFVIADLARAILAMADIPVLPGNPENYVRDEFADGNVWPVYPEIGARFGIPGDYFFKRSKFACPPDKSVSFLDLEGFVQESFDAFAAVARDDLFCERLNSPAYTELDETLKKIAAHKRPSAETSGTKLAAQRLPHSGSSPYRDLPSYQFWRKSVEAIPMRDVDPVVRAPFKIARLTKVATAGSCFAQEISRLLLRHGLNYYMTEPPPIDLSPEVAVKRNYGVFSARYGNLYTAKQLLQLFECAFGAFLPVDRAWRRGDGKYVDPFRSQIEPDGFATVEEVEAARIEHLSLVRRMFETLDVFVFTLGLTEAWRSKQDGAVFPLAPRVVAGEMDFARYEFVNFDVEDVSSDLEYFITRVRQVNPIAKIILTVSPVPLTATYEDCHVLVSTTYSKSVLRAAAEQVVRRRTGYCTYFPSYEIIVGNFNRGTYYESDLRSVTREGVEHVMRSFLANYCEAAASVAISESELSEVEQIARIVCDEERIVGSP